MNIGMVGLGKLGLPVALSMEAHGHDVMGYDLIWHGPIRELAARSLEPNVPELGANSKIVAAAHMDLLVQHSDIIFIAVQTPHLPEYDGARPLPKTRADFDYSHLVRAFDTVAKSAQQLNKEVIVVIISTVLPGTLRRVINCPPQIELVYNPFFIAMSTVISDFENPEFVLLGGPPHRKLMEFYRTIHKKPLFWTAIENAELIKVAYNTFIGMKIVFANTLMEICEKIPNTDVDAVIDGLALATDRLISPKYMRGGMGDGGGCHPRDNIAMSWLARELDLSHDIFTDIMKAREDQTEWLADLIIDAHRKSGLPIKILGKAYKPETALRDGSPALLLAEILKMRGYTFEHHDKIADFWDMTKPAVFFIATKHAEFAEYNYSPGSIILDPWRYITNTDANIYYIGEGGSSCY